jgi:hypothetical protein
MLESSWMVVCCSTSCVAAPHLTAPGLPPELTLLHLRLSISRFTPYPCSIFVPLPSRTIIPLPPCLSPMISIGMAVIVVHYTCPIRHSKLPLFADPCSILFLSVDPCRTLSLSPSILNPPFPYHRRRSSVSRSATASPFCFSSVFVASLLVHWLSSVCSVL